MRTLVVLSVFALLLMVIPAASKVPDDNHIVPGKRIGKWTLEMTVADLVRMNGPAMARASYKAGEDPIADATRDLTDINWSGILVHAFTADQKTVAALVITTKFLVSGWELYKTDKGISLKSSSNQVLKVYGKPTGQTAIDGGRNRLIYDKIGIAFVVWMDYGEMRGIWVFRPGTAKTIWKF